jgi:hypothetical protein
MRQGLTVDRGTSRPLGKSLLRSQSEGKRIGQCTKNDAPDLSRHFTNADYRIAKGSFAWMLGVQCQAPVAGAAGARPDHTISCPTADFAVMHNAPNDVVGYRRC